MPFEEGNTRSVGRPLGSKNKLTKEFLAVYEEAKNKFAHPFTTMMEWAHDENKPIEIRAAMLKECASYVCPKPRQHHSVELDIPVFKSIEQAETWIAALPAALGEELDTTEILSMISSWISSRREGEELELKIKASGQTPVQIIKIEGGLPALPGTQINMGKEPTPGLTNGQGPLIEANKIEKNSGTGTDAVVAKDGEP